MRDPSYRHAGLSCKGRGRPARGRAADDLSQRHPLRPEQGQRRRGGAIITSWPTICQSQGRLRKRSGARGLQPCPIDSCQAARGASRVGAGAGTLAVAVAEGDLVKPRGSPPRIAPASRHIAMLLGTKHAYANLDGPVHSLEQCHDSKTRRQSRRAVAEIDDEHNLSSR
jgi:hypothetical protein